MGGVAESVVNIESETIDVVDDNDKDVGSLRIDEIARCNTDVVFTRCVVTETDSFHFFLIFRSNSC